MVSDKIKNTYKKINITLLMLNVYILTYPIWAKLLRITIPQVTKCAYRMMTKKPCLFCGSTTLLRDFLNGNMSGEYSIQSLVILTYILISLLFRIICIMLKYRYVKFIIAFDMALNITFATYIVSSIILFFNSI